MKKFESDKYPIVLVDWIDSAGDDANWKNKKYIKSMPPCNCRSAGFLLEETKTHITIVQNLDLEERSLMGRMTIPQVAIKKKQILRKG